MSKKTKRQVDTRFGEWETLDSDRNFRHTTTQRMKVAGGWLYRVLYESENEHDLTHSISLTFAPGVFKTEDSF